jgi:anaerobic glycerol-3-phosphate dehydrogenase
MPNQHEVIADLETEIDALRDEAERCRKIDIVAKLAFGLGCITLVTSFIQASAFALVIGIAAVLGSVALLGSNRRDALKRSTGRYAVLPTVRRG